MDVYSSFFHNCPNGEAIKMPFPSGWINNLWWIKTIVDDSAPKETSIQRMNTLHCLKKANLDACY